MTPPEIEQIARHLAGRKGYRLPERGPCTESAHSVTTHFWFKSERVINYRQLMTILRQALADVRFERPKRVSRHRPVRLRTRRTLNHWRY